MKYIVTLSLLTLFACDGGPKDSGDTGMPMDTDTGTGDTDTDTGTTPTFDACNWTDLGLCYEFTDYDGTETWCSDMATQYSITTEYIDGNCASGSVGACDLPAGDDLPVEAIAYYYEPDFTETDAAGACTEAGGTPL